MLVGNKTGTGIEVVAGAGSTLKTFSFKETVFRQKLNII